MFKVNIKNIRTKSVSIVDFEQENVRWIIIYQLFDDLLNFDTVFSLISARPQISAAPLGTHIEISASL